jgi:hypothetical protein
MKRWLWVVPVVVALAAACGGAEHRSIPPRTTEAPTTTVSAYDQLVAWAAQAKPQLQKIQEDIGAIGQTASAGDVRGTVTACQTAANHLTESRRVLEIVPADPKLTAQATEAMAQLGAAYNSCLRADFANMNRLLNEFAVTIRPVIARLGVL